MLIKVRVKLKSRVSKLDKISTSEFKAFLKEVPEKGKANHELVALFSEYFKIPQLNVRIKSGVKSRNKIIEIN
jgi:uncharacterized protein